MSNFVFPTACESAYDETNGSPGAMNLKIAFVISQLGAGGAERVASILCNHWSEVGHEVHLLTYQQKGDPSHYPLSATIHVQQMNLLKKTDGGVGFVLVNLRRILHIRRRLNRIRPDVVVSFMPEPNVIARLATLGSPWRMVMSERVHPAYLPVRRLLKFMQKLLYPLADAVVVQTASIGRYVTENFGAGYTPVLPNPFDKSIFDHEQSVSARDACSILAVGRLDRQKGFDILLEAFAAIAANFPSWSLTILGDGEQRGELERLIADHELQDRVRLPGVVADVASYLRRTALFVHPARFEGYPNAVVEALAAGCPVIAADSPGATCELLGDGKFGRLVPVENIGALRDAMAELMASESQRLELSRRAPAAVQNLDAAEIAQRWLMLFAELCGRKT